MVRLGGANAILLPGFGCCGLDECELVERSNVVVDWRLRWLDSGGNFYRGLDDSSATRFGGINHRTATTAIRARAAAGR